MHKNCNDALYLTCCNSRHCGRLASGKVKTGGIMIEVDWKLVINWRVQAVLLKSFCLGMVVEAGVVLY